jgi:hypothetical protein
MSLRWSWTVVDCVDQDRVSRFWAEALGGTATIDSDGDVAVDIPGGGVKLLFLQVADGKAVKNRIHLDLTPGSPDEQHAEVDRLLALGATRADIGQTGSESWVVLADPEGNEFCVLRGGS